MPSRRRLRSSGSDRLHLCPNSITSILLKTCLKPGFRQVLSRKKVGNQVSDKFSAEKSRKPGLRQKKVANVSLPEFHYIYLAQNLRKTRFPTSFKQKKSRKPGLRQDRSISTCRDRSSGKFSTNKKVGDLVSDKSYDKIDLMEFGLKRIERALLSTVRVI